MGMEMNERIRELAEQAVNSISDHIDFDIPDVFKEKFAELIVAECMKTCDETQAAYLKYRKESDDFQDKNIYAEGEAACDIIKYKLKKQFGVER
jgi:hypothetical protein